MKTVTGEEEFYIPIIFLFAYSVGLGVELPAPQLSAGPFGIKENYEYMFCNAAI